MPAPNGQREEPAPPTGLRARAWALADRVERRWRATARLTRVDAPTLWRMASHGAVLALVLGIFLTSRFAVRAAETQEAPREGVAWAERLGRRAAPFIPQPVLSTTAGRLSEAEEAPAEQGFVSPGLVAEADQTLLPWTEPQTYYVQQGDTLSGIAARFGVTPESVLRYNPALRADPHDMHPGDEIRLLPVEGVVHAVEEGESLEDLAETYEVSVEDILAYTPNELSAGAILEAGRQVFLPGGQLEVEVPSIYQQFTGKPVASWDRSVPIGNVPGTGNFHVSTFGSLSNGFHWGHWAVDLAASTGTPIYAIDGGTVEAAGWLGWAGNAVAIDHGNGYKSLYAHMSSLGVSTGQAVQRGQIIGTMGCTFGWGGWCSGPHLHLEVYYNGQSVNPCAVGACP